MKTGVTDSETSAGAWQVNSPPARRKFADCMRARWYVCESAERGLRRQIAH